MISIHFLGNPQDYVIFMTSPFLFLSRWALLKFFGYSKLVIAATSNP